jgi:hypothetical protein
LHRYDNYPAEENQSQYEAVTGAVAKLYKDKSYESKFGFELGLGYGKVLLTDREPKPPYMWNGKESSEYLKIGPARRSPDHSSFSTCIAAHPKLPIYVTGSGYGKL